MTHLIDEKEFNRIQKALAETESELSKIATRLGEFQNDAEKFTDFQGQFIQALPAIEQLKLSVSTESMQWLDAMQKVEQFQQIKFPTVVQDAQDTIQKMDKSIAQYQDYVEQLKKYSDEIENNLDSKKKEFELLLARQIEYLQKQSSSIPEKINSELQNIKDTLILSQAETEQHYTLIQKNQSMMIKSILGVGGIIIILLICMFWFLFQEKSYNNRDNLEKNNTTIAAPYLPTTETINTAMVTSYPKTTGTIKTFRSPAGSIFCGFFIPSNSEIYTSVRCYIEKEQGFNIDLSACSVKKNISFTLWNDAETKIRCNLNDQVEQNIFANRNNKKYILPYGETIKINGISCLSQGTGMTCSNQNGDSFMMDGNGYYHLLNSANNLENQI